MSGSFRQRPDTRQIAIGAAYAILGALLTWTRLNGLTVYPRGRFSRPPRTQAATYEGWPAPMPSQSAIRAAGVIRKRPSTLPTP